MSLRVFLAADLSSELRSKLAKCQQQLQVELPKVSWVRPESIHLTLKFLGSIEPLLVDQLYQAVKPLCECQSVFTLEAQGLGVFPHVRNPRVLWVGVAGDIQPLLDVVFEVEAALESLGFRAEEKPYHPHLTMARVKHDGSRVGSALTKGGWLESTQMLGSWEIHGITLFQSEMSHSGVVYSPLWMIPFKEESTCSFGEENHLPVKGGGVR